MPVGSLLTPIALVTLAWVTSITLSRPGLHRSPMESLIAKLQSFAIGFSMLWFPLGVLLSGNASMTFRPGSGFQGGSFAMQLFWGMSVVMVLLPLVLLGIRLLLRYRSAQRADDRQ